MLFQKSIANGCYCPRILCSERINISMTGYYPVCISDYLEAIIQAREDKLNAICAVRFEIKLPVFIKEF